MVESELRKASSRVKLMAPSNAQDSEYPQAAQHREEDKHIVHLGLLPHQAGAQEVVGHPDHHRAPEGKDQPLDPVTVTKISVRVGVHHNLVKGWKSTLKHLSDKETTAQFTYSPLQGTGKIWRHAYDFLADWVQHIPRARQHLVTYAGWFSKLAWRPSQHEPNPADKQLGSADTRPTASGMVGAGIGQIASITVLWPINRPWTRS